MVRRHGTYRRIAELSVACPAELEPVPVSSVDAAIERMEAITREAPEDDGLAQFNRLYTEITIAVRDGLNGTTFEDKPFMEALDVAFANLYFDALRNWGCGKQEQVPKMWTVLLERRENRDIAPDPVRRRRGQCPHQP